MSSSLSPAKAYIPFILLRINCRGGSDNFRSRVPGPLDHIFKRNCTSPENDTENDAPYSNEDWASESDLPKISTEPSSNLSMGLTSMAFSPISPELRAYVAEHGNSPLESITVSGEQLDPALYDLFLCATRDADGNLKDINGRQAQMLAKCVRDTTSGIPTQLESRVFRFALAKFRMTSEARSILTSLLCKAASASANAPETPAAPFASAAAASSQNAPAFPADDLGAVSLPTAPTPETTGSEIIPGAGRASAPAEEGKPAGGGGGKGADGATVAALGRLGARLRRASAAGDAGVTTRTLRRLRRTELPDDARPPLALVRLVKVGGVPCAGPVSGTRRVLSRTCAGLAVGAVCPDARKGALAHATRNRAPGLTASRV